MKTNHTKLMWRTECDQQQQDRRKLCVVDADGNKVCSMPWGTLADRANAKFIIRACNNHNKLLKALKEIVEIEWAQDPESRNVRDEHLKQYDALIKKAEGKA